MRKVLHGSLGTWVPWSFTEGVYKGLQGFGGHFSYAVPWSFMKGVLVKGSKVLEGVWVIGFWRVRFKDVCLGLAVEAQVRPLGFELEG